MGFSHRSSNPAIDAFFDHVQQSKGQFMDVGTAYGHYTLEALKRGGKVVAIDMHQQHLDDLNQNCPPEFLSHLTTVHGVFPDEITIADHTFDGILLSRILIFLTGPQILFGLRQVHQWLKPGGRVYIVSGTPFRRDWFPLRAIYEQKKEQQHEWPGMIDNLWSIAPDMQEFFPNTFHLLDEMTTIRVLSQCGFSLISVGYFPTKDENYMDRHENIYAIAQK
jgi:SAM-dependent methyltransferase